MYLESKRNTSSSFGFAPVFEHRYLLALAHRLDDDDDRQVTPLPDLRDRTLIISIKQSEIENYGVNYLPAGASIASAAVSAVISVQPVAATEGRSAFCR